MLLLPAPVLPTIPTFMPAYALKLNSFKLGSSVYLYLMVIRFSSISPL